MTKMELVQRIMVVTRGTLAPAIVDKGIELMVMDYVDGFAATLLSRVKLEVEQAVHTATMNAIEHVKAEGRGDGPDRGW